MATGDLSAVAVLLLALLHEQPMHPYQLHQTLVQRGDARLVRVNPGAVYHAVERLERDGLVEALGVDREGGRPERTTYQVTPEGRAAFGTRLRSLLGDDHPTYPLFPVGLAEANELPAEVVALELRRRRDRVAATLAQLQARYDEARALGLPRRYMLDVEHELALAVAEVAWLDGLVTDLEDQADPLDWTEPFPLAYVEARKAACGPRIPDRSVRS
ncbi:PadR family transcriptional regulator [Cellulomonas composti]|uniref:PadR family transcriptional regulator n=1 Tax=Cellulomonas composti TaxID=266130 RepID=A0A511JA84_9CELL|nr:PadR family transcriptional regulator [Cellulomonas composti]GEL94907.1 PadR family transcriptional regulator [Cellulomonas composti]